MNFTTYFAAMIDLRKNKATANSKPEEDSLRLRELIAIQQNRAYKKTWIWFKYIEYKPYYNEQDIILVTERVGFNKVWHHNKIAEYRKKHNLHYNKPKWIIDAKKQNVSIVEMVKLALKNY